MATKLKLGAKISEALPENGVKNHPSYAVCEDLNPFPLSIGSLDESLLLKAYQNMVTSRRLDEKMLMLLKQNKGYFHIGAAGHEAIQAAIGAQMRPGYDWANIYYRDLCLCISLGIEVEAVLRHHFAKATDPFSGGRQMSEHFHSKELNLIVPSAEVGSQFLPATGLGFGIQRKGQDAIAYVGCGDGATSQGSFFEALNWASRTKAPVLFTVQDNGYAISVPVADQTAGASVYKLGAGYENLARIEVDGTDFVKSYAAVAAAMDHLRAGKGPVLLVAKTVRLLPHSSSDNQDKYKPTEVLEAERKQDPITRFEMLLVEAGVLNEAKIEQIRAEIYQHIDDWAQKIALEPDPDPKTLKKHVFYEGDLGLEYEKTKPAGAPIVMVDAINKAIKEEMARDERVIVYGQDVAKGKGGVFTATRDLTELFGEDRCFNAPLAENSIVGTAVGLSVHGFKPVIEIQFADYIWPALQPLRNMVSTFRWRSNGIWGCPMVIRTPIGGYIHGGLCHSQNIEAFFAHMPGFKIAIPSNAADAKGLLKTAIRLEDPVLFLEHKFLYRQPVARTPEPDEDYLLPFGKANVVQEGTDLTIVTYGALVYKSLTAARALEKEGVKVEVIDLRTIVPFDFDTVLHSVKKTNRVMVVHEDHEFLGFGAEVVAQIADKAFKYLDAPVKRVAGAFTPTPFADSLERVALPQDEDILREARALLQF